MNLKRIQIPFFALAFVIGLIPAVSAAEQGKILSSEWTARPPRIDGVPNDWQGATRTAWKEGNVEYAFRNDASALYVFLTFKDSEFRNKMETTGVTLYFNAAGKEIKDYGILFNKKRATADEMIAFLERSGPVSDDRKAQIRMRPTIYNLYVDEEIRTGASAGKSPGRQAVFKYDHDKKEYTYEFAVPLSNLGEFIAAAGAAEPILTVGFEWGEMTSAQKKQAASEGTGAPAGQESNAAGPAKYAFWCQVILARPA